MQVYEHECPECRCRLRLRGPLRDHQTFSCPDCDVSLRIHVHTGGSEIVRVQDKAAGLASKTDKATISKRVAWSVAAGLLVVFSVFLLGGPEEEPDLPDNEPSKPAIAITQPQPAQPDPPVELPSPPAPALAANDSEPIEVPIVDVDVPLPDETVSTEQPALEPADPQPFFPSEPVQAEEPAALVKSAEQLEAEQLAALQQAQLAAIERGLALRLLNYETTNSLALGDFLAEMSTMTGIPFFASETLAQTDAVVKLSLQEVAVKEVLAAGLKQAGFDYEIRSNGIYVLKL